MSSKSDTLCDFSYNQLTTTTQSVGFFHKIKSYFVDSSSNKSNAVYMKILSAVFYGCSSFLIIAVNKVVLTSYRFPSAKFLGLGQMLATLFILTIGKSMSIINFPDCSLEIPRKIFPLPLFYMGNLICGLGGTQRLSLPMFTVLRRFAILMTLIGEYFVLNVKSTPPIIMTVVAMVGGAIIAASNDLSFDAQGYILVLSNDLFTALNGVYMKEKLDAKDLGKYGLLFYNSLFMLPPMILFSWSTGELALSLQFEYWLNFGFLISFLSSCIMGFLLMYSTILCTSYNSALTTTIVGCLKNILVTYIGMYIGGDYIFSYVNFIGLNISMIGSIVYSYFIFIKSESKLPIASGYKPVPAEDKNEGNNIETKGLELSSK
ncbi:UDP-N-acetylglucosamine/UDP-glucose/GDP-mannose transporter [Tetranychus urticae]|uniref:Sugar phosphate transporter domain-containing protein n=1 Tax=Tetranychus urticae TaxID=32264 RepID=T1K033_TETUR|nr:UDP-N-acetylglucosamine/UDP-glucose/GDP-mannose transporter [Tetranychus urticae]